MIYLPFNLMSVYRNILVTLRRGHETGELERTIWYDKNIVSTFDKS